MNSQLESPQQSHLDLFDLGLFVEQISQSRSLKNQHAPAVELRLALRRPFPEPIRLTPVDQGLRATGSVMTTIARDLSNTGIGFFHTSPITANHVVIEFDGMPDRGLLTRLIWCRFRRDGWYVSGGHFAKVLTIPWEA